MHMATIPGDEERLVMQMGSKIRILDRSMRTVAELDEGFGSVAANEQSIFLASSRVRRISHDGTELASYVEEGRDLETLGGVARVALFHGASNTFNGATLAAVVSCLRA